MGPNWLQNSCLAGPDPPRSHWSSHSPFVGQFWTPFGVPFGCPLETKFALKFNLETITKEYAFCIPKNTLSEAILGLIFKLLPKSFTGNSITLSNQHANWKSFKTHLFSQWKRTLTCSGGHQPTQQIIAFCKSLAQQIACSVPNLNLDPSWHDFWLPKSLPKRSKTLSKWGSYNILIWNHKKS